MEIQHSSHKHTLLQLESTTKQDEGRISCAGCRLDIDGPAFGCKSCEFYLHKHCVELPSTLSHPFHPNGSLQLKLCKPYRRMWALYVCKFCNDYVTEPRFVYVCDQACGSEECKLKGFLLHVDCALLKSSLRHKNHKKHPLAAYNGSVCRVNCAGCGAEFDLCRDDYNTFYVGHGTRFPFYEEPRDLIYRCLKCGDHFHKECLDTPPIKSEDRHHCGGNLNLHLKPFPQDYEEKDYYCDGCGEKRNVRAFSYVCTECEFICHIRCDLFKNIEEKREKKWEQETREKIQEYQIHLDEIMEKIKSLEKEKSRYEELIRKHKEELSSRLNRK
ncbi:hypothetical protein Ancab_021743 [Ancistrocladus abbreviatus]